MIRVREESYRSAMRSYEALHAEEMSLIEGEDEGQGPEEFSVALTIPPTGSFLLLLERLATAFGIRGAS